MRDRSAKAEKVPVLITVHAWLKRIGQASTLRDPRERRKANIAHAKKAHRSYPGAWLFQWGDEPNAPWMVNVDLLRSMYPALIDHPSIEEISDKVDSLEEKVKALERFREMAWLQLRRVGA